MTELINIIINILSAYYWIEVAALTQISAGADINASIYKAEACDQKTYFVKLRRGPFHDASLQLLELLQIEGIEQVIPPLKTIEGKETYQTEDLTLIVYPFVQGQDGFCQSLTDKQWILLGQALRKLHEIDVPPRLKAHIRQEDFSPKWRDAVRSLYTRIGTLSTDDEVALNLWKFLEENKALILQLVERAEELGQKACCRPQKFVLCHSDIHAGNVLLNGNEALYIVDWDHPILAPKERDLMFIGGGVGNVWNLPHEERLFYQGYGQTDMDWTLLAYYRFERIVQDIAEYAQELLIEPTEGKNRLEMYQQFMDMFAPRGVVDIAFASDKHAVE